MRALPDASVDMILCDLPYGTSACKWDSVIPFEPQYGVLLQVQCGLVSKIPRKPEECVRCRDGIQL
nr:MAG TPA: adenine-specific methyltransferase [Caudoviricetes sp.]